MPALPIVTGEDQKILHVKTKPVPAVTKEILQLLQDMYTTTVVAKGAGIAAPQVGRTERVCIAMIDKKLVALINPVITWRSEEMETAEEGCLSLPDVWLHIRRPRDIIVKYTDVKNKPRELKLTDFNARVVQHEVDHLEGILITDHKKESIL